MAHGQPAAIDDELTRGSAWVTLYDAMLDAEVTPDAFLSLALRALPLERQRAERQPHPSYVQRGLLAVLAAAGPRRASRRASSSSCGSGLDGAPTASLKSAWFSALRDTAQTPATVEWLTRVWKQDEKVPGLTLSETDFIRLAQDLAVRDVAGAPSILDQQYERTKNPDRKAQFAFVRPALSADAARARRVVRVARRRRQPPPRAVGARGPALPAPSAARRRRRRSTSSRA